MNKIKLRIDRKWLIIMIVPLLSFLILLMYFTYDSELNNCKAAYNHCANDFNTNCLANPMYAMENPMPFNITFDVELNRTEK